MKRYGVFALLLSLVGCSTPTRIAVEGFGYAYHPYYLSSPAPLEVLDGDTSHLRIERAESHPPAHTYRLNSRYSTGAMRPSFQTHRGDTVALNLRLRHPPIELVYFVQGSGRFESGATIERDLLLKRGGLTAATPNFDAELRYRVASTVLVYYLDGARLDSEGVGPYLSKAQLKVLRRLTSSTMIALEVRVRSHDGSLHTPPPFVLYVEV